MWRHIERAVLITATLVALCAGLDWAVWRVRVAHRTGFGHITVSRMVVASLKGNREEYYGDGSTDEICSRSVLPWGGTRACWWVKRQRVVMER